MKLMKNELPLNKQILYMFEKHIVESAKETAEKEIKHLPD